MVAKELKVFGDVQGVGYRHWANKVAQKLSLYGWAKNEHDGSVTVFVQGGEDSLAEFINWAHEGSPMATVTKVEVKETEIDDSLRGFGIK